jgi:subtilase family serine protease
VRRSSRTRLAVLAAAALGVTLALPAVAGAHPTASGRHPVRVCAQPTRPGVMSCLASVMVGAHGAGPTADAAQQGYGPSDLQSAYALTAASASNGAGVTIAIVDAYNDKTAAKDLSVYRTNYGLPACTAKNKCLSIEGQTGTKKLPKVDKTKGAAGGWELEESLDLDMVSAICPNCRILLVEANSNSDADLGTAVNTAAATAGVRAVSNSYGGGEDPSETSEDASYYHHPGVAVVASAGDDGYGVQYPAASSFVTAVGGTSLVHSSGARGWSETVWGTSSNGEGTGSGCSGYEPKPSWQADTGCAKRTVADVSADADPNTGAAVYDTTPYEGTTFGWVEVGGTSEAAPIIAGIYGLGAALGSGAWTSNLYSHAADLNDVTSGANGSCSPAYLCTARSGYDGPTGLGTPNGIAAF